MDTITDADDTSSSETEDTSSSAPASASASSSSAPSTPPTSSVASLKEPSPRKSLQQQEYLYSLQDENADLRKAIHGLEIILRDHGFSRDGKIVIIPNDDAMRMNRINHMHNNNTSNTNNTNNDVDTGEEGNHHPIPPLPQQQQQQQQYMEMMSMMGMDPERPTVLTRYMEYKVTELQDDLETMEFENNRLAKLVETLSAKASGRDSYRINNNNNNKLRDSKTQKRKLEEKLNAAIHGSKRRETELSETVGGLESNLEASHLQNGILLERISHLEAILGGATGSSNFNFNSKATVAASDPILHHNHHNHHNNEDVVQKLEAKVEVYAKKETLLKEQITALETNLEWNIEESTKRDNLLRGQITALETNLEWNIEELTKRENVLRGQMLHSLELDGQQVDGNGNINGSSNNKSNNNNTNGITSNNDDMEDSCDSFPAAALLNDYFKPLTIPKTANHDQQFNLEAAMQQSLSEMSKIHNQQLEEWKQEESKAREEQLSLQISALETNLEWNMQESKKQENLLKDQISALETNLEWNIEESTKREAFLQERINELETIETDIAATIQNNHSRNQNQELETETDSLTIDSLLIAPDDFLEQKKQLQKIQQQKYSLEEWLSKVVEESTKREKHLQQKITGLKSSNAAFLGTEELFKGRIIELETQLGQLQTDRDKVDDLCKVMESALEKEIHKQEEMAEQVAALEEALDTNEGFHKAQKEGFQTKIVELESKLASLSSIDESSNGNNNAAVAAARSLNAVASASVSARDDINDSFSSRLTDLEQIIALGRRDDKCSSSDPRYNIDNENENENESLSDRLTKLEKMLLQESSGNISSSRDATHTSGGEESNESLTSRISELEKELESEQKNKQYHNKIVTDLQSDLEKSYRKNKGISSRIFELENDLESYRIEKFDRNKRLTKLQNDIEEIANKNEGLSETVMDLESELEIERKEKSDCNKSIADLQSDLEKAIVARDNPILARNLQLEQEAEASEFHREALTKRLTDLRNESKTNSKFIKSMKAYIHRNEVELESAKANEERLHKRIEELTLTNQESKNNSNNKNSAKNSVSSIPKSSVSSIQTYLQAELDSAKTEQKRLTVCIGNLSKKLEESNSSFNIEQDRLQTRIEDLTKKLDESKSNSIAEEDRLNECIEDLTGKLEESKSNSSAENEYFNQCIEDLTNKLKESKSNSSAEKERLTKRIEDLSNKLEESNSNHNSEQKLVKKRIVDHTLTNKKRIIDLTTKLEEVKSKSTVEKQRLNKHIEELTSKLEESSNISNKNSNKKELQQTPTILVIPEIENEPEPERTEARANPPLTKVQNELLGELKNELGNRQNLAELEELKKEFVDTVIQHKARELELSSKTEVLETELEFGQHEHERLERVVFVLKNELKMAAFNHEPVVTRNRELEREHESHKAEQERIGKEAADLQEQLQTTSKNFHNDILDLKMKLKSKQSEFEHLTEFKHELEAELEETTDKVRKIEMEFETAAKTMEATYGKLSLRNTQLEKELFSYKSENQYLNKFIGELQTELAEKHGIKREMPPSITKTHELKIGSINELSDRSSHDDLIESERLEPHLRDELTESERLNQSKLSINDDIDDSDVGLRNSGSIDDDFGKNDDDFEMSSSSASSSSYSSEESGDSERERLVSDIASIEKKLEAEKSKRESFNTIVAELEEEKRKDEIKDELKDGKGRKTIAKIRESEAELEVLNAHIYELESDLEDLLDELWDYDRDQEPVSREEKRDIDGRVEELDGSKNRERLSSRIVELEKEMEELEDELEETIERNKSEKQTLANKNSNLAKMVEAMIEKGKKEQHVLAIRNNELEKELVSTIENGRKDQQTLAIHYIEKERELKEKERELKETAAEANIHEIRLKSQIAQLEMDLDSYRSNYTKNNQEHLLTQLKILMQENDEDNTDNHAEEDNQSELAQDSHRRDEDRLVAKVSDLKKKYDSTVNENQLLHETIVDIEANVLSAQEKIERSEKEVEDLSTKYAQLETKLKNSEEDHETGIWEAEQKMRDLIETVNLERREKKRFQVEGNVLKQDFEALREENENLSSQIELLETLVKEGKNERVTLVRCVAELEEEIRSASTRNDTDQERFTKLRKKLEINKRKIESLSSQIQLHEAEKQEYSVLSRRFSALEKELQSTIEKSKSEQQLHLELKNKLVEIKQRLIEVTMKNQAECANFDNRNRKLQTQLESTTKELESTIEKNVSLCADLRFFEAENELNISGVDELPSMFEENEDIFRKIQSYESGTSQKELVFPLTPGSNAHTATEKTDFDEDTFTSDRENSPVSLNGCVEKGVEGQGDMDSRGTDSNHNSIITTRAANGGLTSAPLLVENDDSGGVTNPRPLPDKTQNQKIIEDYLTPLVEKADQALGQEIPSTIVQGVHVGLLLQAEKVMSGSFSWEHFETILEEICQEYDQDTWFEIQEAFFVGWEENEMGGDIDDQDRQDERYDQ